MIGLDAKQYAHIETMTDLDAFAKQYLMDNYQLEIPIRQTLFLMKCVKHPIQKVVDAPDKIITDPQTNESGSATPNPANGLFLAQPFPKVESVQDWIGVAAVVYANHITNNIVFQYVHNIMVNIVSDLCRVPPRHLFFVLN